MEITKGWCCQRCRWSCRALSCWGPWGSRSGDGRATRSLYRAAPRSWSWAPRRILRRSSPRCSILLRPQSPDAPAEPRRVGAHSFRRWRRRRRERPKGTRSRRSPYATPTLEQDGRLQTSTGGGKGRWRCLYFRAFDLIVPATYQPNRPPNLLPNDQPLAVVFAIIIPINHIGWERIGFLGIRIINSDQKTLSVNLEDWKKNIN